MTPTGPPWVLSSNGQGRKNNSGDVMPGNFWAILSELAGNFFVCATISASTVLRPESTREINKLLKRK